MDDVEAEVGRLLQARQPQEAATAALRGFGPQVYGYLIAVLHDGSAADDAFAQFSEDFWIGLGAFRGECAVKTYAYKIARHAALRVVEDPYRRRGRRLESEEMSALVENIRSSTAQHLRSEVKDAMTQLRQSLTPDDQTLLILRIDRALSWRDVAEVLDVDDAVVRKRFERIKDRLRELARAEGLIVE